jgi:hypothetical protein
MLGCDPIAAPGLRYQLFHRTAAAVVEARRFVSSAAAMILHSFSPEHRWFDDFAAFCALFCTTTQRGIPSVVTLPDGRPLILGWATGNRVTSLSRRQDLILAPVEKASRRRQPVDNFAVNTFILQNQIVTKRDIAGPSKVAADRSARPHITPSGSSGSPG